MASRGVWPGVLPAALHAVEADDGDGFRAATFVKTSPANILAPFFSGAELDLGNVLVSFHSPAAASSLIVTGGLEGE
jgi:hypothetical protein